jgi:hypothetical protein
MRLVWEGAGLPGSGMMRRMPAASLLPWACVQIVLAGLAPVVVGLVALCAG